MQEITLSMAKSFLDVIHGADDVKLQMLLDGAIDEARQYLNIDALTDLTSEEGGNLPNSVVVGVMLLLQAIYQASPEDAAQLRRAAEIKLHPYRVNLGV